MKVLSLRIPEDVDRGLAVMAKRRRVAKSALAREALSRYVVGRKVRARSALDLASDVISRVKRGPTDLSYNPRYLADFGE